MRFFSAPYDIVVRHTASPCPRCTLIEGAFQDEIWSDLLLEVRATCECAELDDIEWLVRERYVRDFSIASSVDRIAVLASLDTGADESSVRLFTRVVSGEGVPLACGFGTIVCLRRDTGTARPLPRVVLDLLRSPNGYRESSVSSFPETALSEAADEVLFPAGVRALAASVLASENGARRRVSPRAVAAVRTSGDTTTSIDIVTSPGRSRSTGAFTLSLPGFTELAAPARGAAFTFPGDQSYSGRLLRELHGYLPYLADHFHQADNVARRVFRQEFLPLVEVDTLALHDQRLERCPELAHLGVVLCGVLVAETLQEHGIRPEVLIGEGLGELSALAVAGAIDVATALRLAAQRALSRRRQQNGSPSEEAVPGLATGEVPFSTPRFQIFLTGARVGPWESLALERELATWLTRVPDLTAAAAAARAAGCEQFIECGPSGVLQITGEAQQAPADASPAGLRDGVPAASVPPLLRPESPQDARA